METSSILYSLKVWLTSVVLAPLIYIVIQACLGESYQLGFAAGLYEQIKEYALLILLVGLFSFCTWVAFILSIVGVSICFPSFRYLKYVIALIGVLLTAGTFEFFLPEAFSIHSEYFLLMLANCICIAGGSCFYKLETARELGTAHINK